MPGTKGAKKVRRGAGKGKRTGLKTGLRRYKKKTSGPMIRNAFSQKEWASHSEVLTLQDGQVGFQSNTMYKKDVDLSQFPRASRIAQNYREFRITGLTFRFKPRYDTFTATTNEATATPIPQFYYMVDRNGALNMVTTTIQNLQQMGARAHRFDDKNIVVRYKPAVVVGLYNDVTAPNPVYTMKKISPWLSTNSRVDAQWNPSNTPHKGLYWYLQTVGLPGDGTYEYDVELEINFQFRAPLSVLNPSS